MREIIEPIRQTLPSMRSVTINEPAIRDFIDSIQPEELLVTDFDDQVAGGLTEPQRVAFTIVYNAINFCYWGDPKWAVNIDGKIEDGGNALLLLMRRALDNGYDLLNPDFLMQLSEAEFAEITKGNVEIPLMPQRAKILRELGKITREKYGGSFESVIEAGEYQADQIVRVLVRDFPEVFDDQAMYKGSKLRFYKRAQLIPSNLSDMYRTGYYHHEIINMDQLTAFADYKVPQVLRKMKILQYSDMLADKLDRFEEIAAGSEEEVEIRMATVWAVHLATEAAQDRYPGIMASKIDNLVWFRGQVKSPDDKPYHRTRTTCY